MGLMLLDLRRGMERPACPACRSDLIREERYLRSILHEYVNDPSVRIRLLDGLGYCARHTWLLSRVERSLYGDATGSSILFESILGEWQRRIASFNRTERRRRSPPPRPGAECPVCVHVAQGSAAELRELARALGDTDERVRRAYEESNGLCLPHLAALLAIAPESPERDEIVARIERTVSELRAELREFDRKRAWDKRHEPKGDEQTAWLRAALVLGGAYEALAAEARDQVWPRTYGVDSPREREGRSRDARHRVHQRHDR